MLTLILQTGVTALLLCFSVFALLAGRASPPGVPPAHRSAWLVSGLVFGAYGINKLVQGVYGIMAFAAGQGAPVFTSYLRAAPVFNHSRTLLLYAFYGMLAWLAYRGRLGSRDTAAFWATGTLAVVAGGVYGNVEGTLQAGRHFTATAVIDTAGFAILASLLFALMLRDTVDRLLWCALAAQGFRSIIGVIFLAAMAWLETPGTWSPPYWAIELCRFVLAGIMAGCAVRRYVLARRRASVPGLLPPSRQLQPSLM